MPDVVKRPSKSPLTRDSVRLQLLMEEAHKLEIGARIRELRQRSRYKQPAIAEKLGIGLRRYQGIEEKGTTLFEQVEQIAAIHEVDPNWIWDGEERGPTPDVLATLGDEGRLGKIERKLDAILAAQRATAAALQTLQEGLQSTPARASKRRRQAAG